MNLILCALAVVHDLGELQLRIAVKQLHLTDFLEVHTHRVVNGKAFLDEHLLHFLGGFQLCDLVFKVEVRSIHVAGDFDAHVFQRFIELLNLLDIVIDILECFHDLALGQRALRLTALDELLDLVALLLCVVFLLGRGFGFLCTH